MITRQVGRVAYRRMLGLLALLALVLSGCGQTGGGGIYDGTVAPTATPSGAAKPANTPTATTEPTSTPTIAVEPTSTPTATAEPTRAPTATVEPTSTPAGAVAEVEMVNIQFVPQELTVAVGTTVTWKNEDSFPHTVTSGIRDSPTGLFDETVNAGQTFSFTFDEAGTYNYYCRIHPGMDGVIIVE
jgi:plastocyanin